MRFCLCRYYELVDPRNGILKKGREILLTGCHLRTAAEGSGHPRLLPTEYLVILLDEVILQVLPFIFLYLLSVKYQIKMAQYSSSGVGPCGIFLKIV